MDPFKVLKTQWSPGDQREVEDWRIEKQEGIEYDSYRRVYLADRREWSIIGQIMKDDGRKYYILECVE
jgi:hypothetical protein